MLVGESVTDSARWRDSWPASDPGVGCSQAIASPQTRLVLMGKKNLKEIYALAVCFAAVMFIIVNGATSLHQLVRVLNPKFTVSGYEYGRSLSDEAFLKAWPDRTPMPDSASLPRLRAEAFETALRAEQHDGLRGLLESLAYVTTAAVAFGVHWVFARREQRQGCAAGV